LGITNYYTIVSL